MLQKDLKLETELKTSRPSSKPRNRMDHTITEEQVYQRLFQDVRERTRKKQGFEPLENNRKYESVGNLSISSLSRGDFRNNPSHYKDNESLHIPKINKKSRKIATPKRDKHISINTVLYNDAEIRKEKSRIQKQSSKSREKHKVAQQKKVTSKTSKKILIKKYLLEFDEIALKLGVGEDPESPIHYTQFIMLMQQFGFVSDQNEKDYDKLKMIWGIVQDQNSNEDSGNYCRKHSLKVICAAVCGFSTKWMFKDYTKGQDVKLKAPKRSAIDLYGVDSMQIKLDIGCFIETLLFLNHQEEADYIQRLFVPLYNNRLLVKERQKHSKRKTEEQMNSQLHKPQINRVSSSANRSMRSQGRVEERLLNKQKEYEKKKMFLTKQRDEKYKDCTFTPVINK